MNKKKFVLSAVTALGIASVGAVTGFAEGEIGPETGLTCSYVPGISCNEKMEEPVLFTPPVEGVPEEDEGEVVMVAYVNSIAADATESLNAVAEEPVDMTTAAIEDNAAKSEYSVSGSDSETDGTMVIAPAPTDKITAEEKGEDENAGEYADMGIGAEVTTGVNPTTGVRDGALPIAAIAASAAAILFAKKKIR